MPPTLVALWFAVTISASAALSRLSPDLAIRLDGGNSTALEFEASMAAGEQTPTGAARAVALAKRSLLASPLSSDGAAALGIARLTLSPSADVLPIFSYSQFLSRRTALTQLWFIEHSVDRGDIPGALKAYDHLFRVSDYYRAQFLPVLVAASDQPEVARGVAHLLATRPQWRNEYFSGLLGTFPGADNFTSLTRAFRFDMGDADDAHRLTQAMTRLVEADRPDLAFGLYRETAGASIAAEPVRDGDFRRAGGLTPFDWELTENDALLAEIGTNDLGTPVLRLTNRGGHPGPFARQLLMLRPGAWRLSFMVGNVGESVADRPQMRIECLGGSPILSATLFPSSPEKGRSVTTIFAVPPGRCPAQWLVVQSGNPIDAIAIQQWVSRIRLSTVGRPLGDRR